MIYLKKFVGQLKGNGGYSFPLTIGIILSILIVIAGISEYMRINLIIHGIEESVQNAVIAVSIENYDNNYSPLREGYSGGYKIPEDVWIEHVDDGNVAGKLAELLDLEQHGSSYVRRTQQQVEYSLSDLHVVILNTGIAPESGARVFEAETYVTAEIPLSFGWDKIAPLDIDLKVKSKYMARF